MRLIDKDVLIKALKTYYPCESNRKMKYKDIMANILMDIEHADEVDPVKHGNIITVYDELPDVLLPSYFCSVCKSRNYVGKTKYCYNCGALMDEEVIE